MRHLKRKTPAPKEPADSSNSNGNGTVNDSTPESTEAPEPGPSQPKAPRVKRPKTPDTTGTANPSPRVTRSGRGPQTAVARPKFAAVKKVKPKAPEPLTFGELADKLDPNPQAPTHWRKFIDRNDKMIMFYNLDLTAPIPKISKSVQVRCISVKEENVEKQKLVPTVCSNGRKLSPAKVSAVLNSDYVETIEDLTKLVQRFDVLEDMESNGGGLANQEDASNKPKKVRKRKLPENGTIPKKSESELLTKKRKPTNGIRKARKGAATPEVATGTETQSTANESQPLKKTRKPATGPRKPRKAAPIAEAGAAAGEEAQSTANESQSLTKKRKPPTGPRKPRKLPPKREVSAGAETESRANPNEALPLDKETKPTNKVRKPRKVVPKSEVAVGAETPSTAHGPNPESQSVIKPTNAVRKPRKVAPKPEVAVGSGAETQPNSILKRGRPKKTVIPPAPATTTAEPPPADNNGVVHAEGQ